MNELNIKFDVLVDNIYNLPLEDRLELKELLEHNIADSRRDEIAANVQAAKDEQKANELKFSNSVDQLKRML